MGSSHSQEDYYVTSSIPKCVFGPCVASLQHTCVLPDVGIDESLLKFSGVNSNTELQTYSDELLNSVPGFVEKLGTSLGALTIIPNAVGLVALVISMIMEICIKSSQQTSGDPYSMFRRVFGEEKASGVRDTMSESVNRYRRYMNNNQRLIEETQRLEQQLSGHLTILRNSLLYDGQMSSRGFKIWVNGAYFNLEMMIHEARLNVQAGKSASDYVYAIKAAVDTYLQDLESLLKEYKTYISHKVILIPFTFCMVIIQNSEVNCGASCRMNTDGPFCCFDSFTSTYIEYLFTEYEPIRSLTYHFSDIKNNIYSLINQHDAFTLPYSRMSSFR